MDGSKSEKATLGAQELKEKVNQALKFDDEKIKYHLVPSYPLEQLAKLYTIGSIKYGDRNWEKGFDYSRCIAALDRHKQAFWMGEDYDIETGLSHMAAIAFYAFAIMEFQYRGTGKDDRPYRNGIQQVGHKINGAVKQQDVGILSSMPDTFEINGVTYYRTHEKDELPL